MTMRTLSPYCAIPDRRSSEIVPSYAATTLAVQFRKQSISMSALLIETLHEPAVSKVEGRRRRRKKLSKRPALGNAPATPSVSREWGEDTGRKARGASSKECVEHMALSRLPGLALSSTSLAGVLTSPPPRQLPDTATLPLPPAHERRKRVPLLVAIKPDNERAEKERFMRANLNYNPLFIYRYPVDKEALDRYGLASNRYLQHAILIMNRALERYGSYENFEEITGGKLLTRPQIFQLVKKYLRQEGLEEEMDVNLSEDLLSRASMCRIKGRPTLNVRIVNLREEWCEGLLRHEVGTHYMRSCNNRCQPWSQWRVRRDLGLRHLNPTEEGLASLHSVLFRQDPCLWRAALLYYTAHQAAQMSFKELFKDLARFVRNPAVRWDYCLRAKRGQTDTSKPGGFCKDQVYLQGALQILKRRRTIDFEMLMRLGKVSHFDIGYLQQKADLAHTRMPSFMQNLAIYRKHIDFIAQANGLTDRVLEDVE